MHLYIDVYVYIYIYTYVCVTYTRIHTYNPRPFFSCPGLELLELDELLLLKELVLLTYRATHLSFFAGARPSGCTSVPYRFL